MSLQLRLSWSRSVPSGSVPLPPVGGCWVLVTFSLASLPCRFLPLPVVLLTEALLRCRSQGGDGGSQLLPDDTLTQLLPCSFSLHYFQQPLALAHPGKMVGWWRDNRVYCTLGRPFPSPRTTWGWRLCVTLHLGPSCLDVTPLARLRTEL